MILFFIFALNNLQKDTANLPQMRRFSLQFCDFLYQNEDVLNFIRIDPRYFSLLMKKKKKIVLVFIFPCHIRGGDIARSK